MKYLIQVVENEPAGTEVGAVRAIDADSGLAGEVWYFIAGASGDDDDGVGSSRSVSISSPRHQANDDSSVKPNRPGLSGSSSAAAAAETVEGGADDGASSESTSATTLFSIDRQTGLISTNRVLDAELSTEYQLLIVARDRGVPSLSSAMPVCLSNLSDNSCMPGLLKIPLTHI